MSGKPGRSGRRRKPVELHQLAGTYRADRHAVAVAASPVTPVSDALTDGLGEAGTDFLRSMLEDYEFSASEAHVVRLAAEAVDDNSTARRGGDLKASRAAVRQVLACLGRLGVPVVEAR